MVNQKFPTLAKAGLVSDLTHSLTYYKLFKEMNVRCIVLIRYISFVGQNDLIHAWGLDMQLGYCAQARVFTIPCFVKYFSGHCDFLQFSTAVG